MADAGSGGVSCGALTQPPSPQLEICERSMREVPLVPSQHLVESGKEVAVTKSEMEAHPLGTVKQEAKRPEFFPQPPDHTIGMRRHDPPEIQLPESGEEIAVTKSVHAAEVVRQEANHPEFFLQPPDHTIEKRVHDPPEIQLLGSGKEIAVTYSEMVVHALGAVKQEANHPEIFPSPANHTIEKRCHDPPEILLPLAKLHRTLNPHGKQLSATVQSMPTVEADHYISPSGSCNFQVHDINVLERAEIVDVSCASELEETPEPYVSMTGKAQVVAEMLEYTFDSCEGSNFNPGTKMMVANLLQFLSKQYEDDKALDVAETERLKEELSLEKMKLASTLEQQSKLAMKNLEKSPSGVSVQNEVLKNGLESLGDLEHENQELRTVIAAMGKDMDALKNKNEKLQNEFLRTSKTIEQLKKAIHEKSEQCAITQDVVSSCMQHVKVLKSTIESRDRVIAMQNKEIMVFRGLVGKRMHDHEVPPKLQFNPVMSAADDLIVIKEQPLSRIQKKKMKAASISGSIDATGIPKFDSAQRSLVLAIMSLGKSLDGKLKALFSSGGDKIASHEKQWKHCISRLIPHGYRIDNSPCFKHVWNHWISAIMFYDFEHMCFGSHEAGIPEKVNKLDVLKNIPKPGAFKSCTRFQAFVKRKYHSLFPEWFWLQPLMKLLDSDL